MAQFESPAVAGVERMGLSSTGTGPRGRVDPEYCRFGVFDHCPQCGGEMAPEHAHYRCRMCGWRDSCCD